ncbi:glycosyltransferase [Chitinibacter tainanensis]|uniref:glycosyltransferase n=1 Tax=Chitinibacter tainanensis TaxID=230667 RepID=UPI00040FAF8C|nr:glycosyltransferase family 2 protein [Chitinibacter tainanensis]
MSELANILFWLAATSIAAEIAVTLALMLIVYFRKESDRPAAGVKLPSQIGVILPVYNEAAGLEAAFRSLSEQSVMRHGVELIIAVVDDGSKDGSDVIIDRWRDELIHRGIRVTHHRNQTNSGNKAIPLNIGLAMLPKDIPAVVVMDGDTILSKNAILKMATKMAERPELAGVSGAVMIREDQRHTFLGACQHHEHQGGYPLTKTAMGRIGRVRVMSGALCMHAGWALRRLGAWDKDWLVEDVCWTTLAIMQGGKVEYSAEAFAWTEAPQSLSRLCRQRRRWSRGNAEAFKVSVGINKVKGLLLWLPWLPLVFAPLWRVAGLLSPTLAPWVIFLFFLQLEGLTMTTVQNLSLKERVKGIAATWTVELITFGHSLTGLIDELIGRRKTWMTR